MCVGLLEQTSCKQLRILGLLSSSWLAGIAIYVLNLVGFNILSFFHFFINLFCNFQKLLLIFIFIVLIIKSYFQRLVCCITQQSQVTFQSWLQFSSPSHVTCGANVEQLAAARKDNAAVKKSNVSSNIGLLFPLLFGLLLGPCPPVGFPGFPCVFCGTPQE